MAVENARTACASANLGQGRSLPTNEAVRECGMPPNKGMKLTKRGELRSFAAYPRCWADLLAGSYERVSRAWTRRPMEGRTRQAATPPNLGPSSHGCSRQAAVGAVGQCGIRVRESTAADLVAQLRARRVRGLRQ